jgi:DNA polymerase IV
MFGLDETMAASQKEEKEQFFRSLYQLDHLSDDDVPLMPTPKLSYRSPSAKVTARAVQVSRPLAPSIAPEDVSLQQSVASEVASEPEPQQNPKTRTRRPTTVQPPPRLVSAKLSKGKKRPKFRIIPEAEQIFTGSTFYFIPNNDVAGPRKLRIQRALEYGAVWERVWSARVTHVIVDSNLTMPDVPRHFRVEKLPVSVLLFQC